MPNGSLIEARAAWLETVLGVSLPPASAGPERESDSTEGGYKEWKERRAAKRRKKRLARELVERPAIEPHQATRASEKLTALDDEDRERVTRLIDDAPGDGEKDYLRKALACGRSPDDLETFAAKIHGKSEKWLRDNLRITGNTRGQGIQQQWVMSCQASTVQAVRALADPIYALELHEAHDRIHKVDHDTSTPLAQEQKTLLETPTPSGHTGRAVSHADETNDDYGTGRGANDLLNDLSDVTGLTYTVTMVDAASRDTAVDDITAALQLGKPVPLSVGDDEGELAHYVLATSVNAGPPVTFLIHDPATGETVTRTRNQVTGNALDLPSGWSRLNKYEKPS